MQRVFDSMYLKLRKEEIEKARFRIKKIKIDSVLQNITKSCWKFNLPYEIYIKTKDCVVIKLFGLNESVLIKYHNSEVVFINEINAFLNEMDETNADRGIYITTGRFRMSKKYMYSLGKVKNIILENGTSFIINQLGIQGRVEEELKETRLDFYKYFPS